MPGADRARFRPAVLAVAWFLLLLWAVRAADTLLGLSLVPFGVLPRTVDGLPGILLAPLIHGSWGHLVSNSFALAVLGVTLFYGYPRSAPVVVPFVWLLSGAGVWLLARGNYHVGASGLTHGLMFFIFVSGILRRDPLAMALSMIVFFLYGGMVWSIFPGEPGISFESHFFGALAGVLAAFLFRGRDPLPPRKTYDWEDEDGEVSGGGGGDRDHW